MVWLGSDYQHIPTKIHDKKHRVTLDSNEEDSFKIHMPNKIINLKICPNGLYIYIYSQTSNQVQLIFVITVK